jgi:hypothetical protein
MTSFKKASARPQIPHVAALASALSHRGSTLPKHGDIGGANLSLGPDAVAKMTRRREGQEITEGEMAATTRLDRCRNFELLLRKKLLVICGGDHSVCREYLLSLLAFDEKKWSKVPGRKSAERQFFVETLQSFIGGEWRRTVHITDLEFMFGTLYAPRLHRNQKNSTTQIISHVAHVASRLAQQMFPSDKIPPKFQVSTAPLSVTSGMETRGEGCRSSGAPLVLNAPFDHVAIRKHHAIRGVEVTAPIPRASVGTVSSSEPKWQQCSQEVSDSFALEGEHLQLTSDTTHENISTRQSTELGSSVEKNDRHLLMRYRHCHSLIPVPTRSAATVCEMRASRLML